MKTLSEQLACAKRELALRLRVYPKWITAGRMTQDQSDHEVACMESIAAALQKMQWLEQASEEIKLKGNQC